MRYCPLCGRQYNADVMYCYGAADRPHEEVATEPVPESPPPDQPPPPDDPMPHRCDLLVQAAINYQQGAFAPSAYIAECQAIIDGLRD